MMKKYSLMIAAAAMLSMAAMGCKPADKGSDTEEEETTEQVTENTQAQADGVETPANMRDTQSFKVGDLTGAKVDTAGYKTTPSGLMYKEVKAGQGKQPASADAIVKVHYAGKLLDGTVFDSSYERGEPIEFPLNAVIPGWTEGVQLMKEGSKYQFIIPSGLAYGPQGTPGGPIGPNEDLYFEVELLEVK